MKHKHCQPKACQRIRPVGLALALTVTSLALAAGARADMGVPVVAYGCDKQHDTLTLNFHWIFEGNHDFDAALKAGNAWDVTRLIEMGTDEQGQDIRKTARSVERECRLSDGSYRVRIGPSYLSIHMRGFCGGAVTATAQVTRGGTIIYPDTPFQDCVHSTPTITAVVIKPGQAPQVEHEEQ